MITKDVNAMRLSGLGIVRKQVDTRWTVMSFRIVESNKSLR